jgi:DnaK suppressor protein
MNEGDLLHYKTLLLANEEELSAIGSLAGSTAAAGQPRGYPANMAASETDAAGMQIRLNETDGKVLRAIEDALARIRQGRFGICEECGQPISKARLEAVPWSRYCKDCKDRQESRR